MNDTHRKQRAQSWCFENNITEAEVKMAWNTAAQERNNVIVQLQNQGSKWWSLPPHLLQELIDQYGQKQKEEDQ